MDGSMGVIWFYDGKWNVSTRGSFNSPQAVKGLEILKQKYPRFFVSAHEKITYVCEIIYPENRIVVDYKGEEKLVLLAAFDTETYNELDDDALYVVSEASGLELPKRYYFNSFLELEESVKSWPKEQEGVVVRFNDGSRLKIKGDEYCLLHKTLSHFSPLAVWEAIKDNVEIEYISQLPDEFQEQYKVWKADFLLQAQTIWDGVVRLYESTKNLTDKELGLKNQAKELGDYGGMIFAIRKNGADLNNKKARNWVFEHFRPKANVLKKFEE
jgi:RNA ligase